MGGQEKVVPTKAVVEHTKPDDEKCNFCHIVAAFLPTSPTATPYDADVWDMDKTEEPTLVVLSTPHLIAFLDIYPTTEGHLLICPRKHHEKMGFMPREEAAEIGRVLPLLTRCVMRAVMPDIPVADCDYNIVQNNGPGAAQAVGHVHFHIVPRPPIGYKRPDKEGLVPPTKSKYPPNKFPIRFGEASKIMFGRTYRPHYLPFDEADELRAYRIRHEIAKEWKVFEAELEKEGRWSGKL